MKCSVCLVDNRPELDPIEIEKVLRSVPKHRVLESIERLIGQGRVAVSQVQAGYHALMEQVSHV